MAEDPQGVPISAIVFGGRRASLVPLVFEARDWTHGVLVGAAMGSETTAAATGAVGVMRRDPMAMKPFCGYNFADYFAHWLSFDQPGAKLPRVFHVNWFRKGDDGKFLWPGFGDNLRVLEWMIRRVEGSVAATETPIGHLPVAGDLNLEGVALSDEARTKLFGLDRAGWQAEFASLGEYLARVRPAPAAGAAATSSSGSPGRWPESAWAADPPSEAPLVRGFFFAAGPTDSGSPMQRLAKENE